MKLINLEIEGLNSFKNKTTIDFKSLFDKKFFGIFGATGSGKSSILDAVFFALYGKVLRVKSENEFINIKKTSANVKLLFEMRDKGVDKTFLVTRSYKLTPKKQLVKNAELVLINGEEKTTLATGDNETTSKVQEIVGFDSEQFSRFIALPQGQFSQFLKDSPKSKVETMAKVFCLEKYGEQFSTKLKNLRNENLKRKSYLTGVLDQYANVDENVITAEEEQVKNLQKQAAVKSNELLDLKEKYLSAEKNFELIKEKEKNDVKIRGIEDKTEEIDADLKKLSILKATFTLHPLFTKLKLLKQEKEELQQELDRLTNEITATSNSYIKLVSVNDKQKTEISLKLAELERRQSLLLAIRADAERYHDLEKQKADLAKEIEQRKLDTQKLKDVYDSHSLSLQNNLNIIAELERFVVKDEIGENVISAVKEFEGLKAYSKSLNLALGDAKNEKTEIVDRKNELLKQLVENDEKTNTYKAQIEKTNQTLQNMFSGETNFEKMAVSATNKLAYLKLQGTDYLEREVEISTLKESANKLLSQIKAEQDAQKNIIDDLEKVKTDIESEVRLDEIDKDKVKKLKELQKELKETFVSSKQNQLILDEKRDYILSQITRLQKKQKELLGENELFKDLTFEKLENKVLSAENTLYKLLELSTSLEKTKEQALLKDRVCVKISSTIDALSKEEQALIEKINDLQTKLQKANAKLEQFEKLNSEGALKNAKNYDQNFNEQIIVLKQQKDVIPQIIRFVNLKQNSADSYFDAKAKLNEKESKFEGVCLDMKIILNKLRDLNVKGYIKDEIANNFSAIDSLRQALKNITDAETEVLKNEAKLKIQKASTISSLVIKEEEVENTQEELDGQCKLAGVSESDLLTEVVYDDITDLEQKLMNFVKEKNEVVQEGERLKGLITNSKITQAKLLQMKENMIKCEKANLNLQAEIAFLLKQIEKDKVNVKKLAYFKAELDGTIQKEKNYAKLTEMNDGDAILKFLTEEYILQITEKANTYFATLTNGRFQLIYSGDFQIVDNLNGGLTRSVGTLSGGETFLASLSLAIAIVETVSLLHDKPLDFVFLDEGFGTLDEDSIEMVMTALRNLRKIKLVFGLITHEELVKFKTPTRIEVYKTEENGSRIETVV